MNTAKQELEEIRAQVENLRVAIKEISHEISNPVGVLRMAVHFLENTDPAPEKKAHYFSLMNDSLNKIEAHLKQLKIVREDPTKKIGEILNPAGEGSSLGAEATPS